MILHDEPRPLLAHCHFPDISESLIFDLVHMTLRAQRNVSVNLLSTVLSMMVMLSLDDR